MPIKVQKKKRTGFKPLDKPNISNQEKQEINVQISDKIETKCQRTLETLVELDNEIDLLIEKGKTKGYVCKMCCVEMNTNQHINTRQVY